MRKTVAIVVSVAIFLFALQNFALARYFPQLPRLTTDFSPAYLQRELQSIAQQPGQTLFLGDSVLWGYGLPPQQTMVSILASEGCPCLNLSFKAGSPPNYYALVRLIEAAGIRPKAVVLEINQKVFSQTDSSYQTLHPTLAQLAWQFFSERDRTLLTSMPVNPIQQRADRVLSSIWSAYAMRTDIREALLGENDAKTPTRRATANDFMGAYDLAPLTEKNVAVHFLNETIASLRQAGIQTIAFMTPTNHALLHEYIDAPEYQTNQAYLRRLLERQGVQIVDLDKAIPAGDFFDNDHMTPQGQRRFAALLAPFVRSGR